MGSEMCIRDSISAPPSPPPPAQSRGSVNPSVPASQSQSPPPTGPAPSTMLTIHAGASSSPKPGGATASTPAPPGPSKSILYVTPVVTVSGSSGASAPPPPSNSPSPTRYGPSTSPKRIQDPTITLNKPKATNFPDGRPFKQTAEFNYCHYHKHPLWYTYRISGQLWGGDNMTESKFYGAVGQCGVGSEREWHEPNGKSSLVLFTGLSVVTGWGVWWCARTVARDALCGPLRALSYVSTPFRRHISQVSP